MLTDAYLESLPPCEDGCEDGGTPCEMRSALLWMNRKARGYARRGVISPLSTAGRSESSKPFVAATVRIRRAGRLKAGSTIGQIDWIGTGTCTYTSGPISGDAIASYMSGSLLKTLPSGAQIVVSGKRRRVLDIFLESCGPWLVSHGYTLHPGIAGSQVSYVTIRKGRNRWTMTYAETITGVGSDVLVGFARDAGVLPEGSFRKGSVAALWYALDAYRGFLVENFGCAWSLTAGMTAMHCARKFLPADFKKWKPVPLLEAMERDGHGFRGGIAHADRYRGPAWTIDVNRQYTHMLRSPLPYRSAFGRYESDESTPGVFLCRVRLSHAIFYPLGIWNGSGFTLQTSHGVGTYVCVLHTAEFEALRGWGVDIAAWYGYVFTRTFSLEGFVQHLQTMLDRVGRDSNAGRLLKTIGNYVYGKFAQNPVQVELMYSQERPADRSWHPFWDIYNKQWPMIWERKRVCSTSSQHIEVAGTIAASARSQTVQMWQLLSALGFRVVRCHTDSLTVSTDPSGAISLDSEKIGAWKPDNYCPDAIILGINAYVDSKGAHVAGVSDPTWEMVQAAYDGYVTYAPQKMNGPLLGFARDRRLARRRIG